MNQKIQNQINLMHAALEETHNIKVIDALFSKIDDTHARQEKQKHVERYAQLMSKLAATIIEDAGVREVNVTVHDKINY